MVMFTGYMVKYFKICFNSNSINKVFISFNFVPDFNFISSERFNRIT